jgi:uncharacterized membrane protein YqjE
MPPDAPVVGALRGAVDRALATVVDIGRNRLELATVELVEERLRLARLAIVAIGTLFFAFASLCAVTAAIVLVLEPADRPLALGLAAALFGAVAGLGAWRWHHLIATRPPLLQATLAELNADGAALRGHAP